MATELAFLCGKFERINQLVDIVVAHARTFIERLDVYLIKLEALTTKNYILESIDFGKSVLQELGFALPSNPTNQDVQQAFQSVSNLIAGHEISDLLHLPKMVDPQKIAIMQIAFRISVACYVSGSLLYPMVIILQVTLSVQYGNTSISAVGYACYGMLLNHLMQNTAATQFRELSYQMAMAGDAKNIRPQTLFIIGCFLIHRTSHLRESIPVMQESYQVGLETGQLEYVGHVLNQISVNIYWSGNPLVEVAAQMRAYHQQLVNLNVLPSASYIAFLWESVVSFIGNLHQAPLDWKQYTQQENHSSN